LDTTSEKLTNKKYFLQKVAKVISIFSVIAAIGSIGYVLLANPSDGLKLTFGVVAFFFSAMSVVLFAIGNANLPDLSIKLKKD